MSADPEPLIVRGNELDEAAVDEINAHLADGGPVWFISEDTQSTPRPASQAALPDGWISVGYTSEDGS